MRRSLLATATLLTAAATVAPSLAARHHAPDTGVWLEDQVSAWELGTPADVLALRAQNPEYDFMARTFLVLTLADRALVQADQGHRYVAVMDRIIEDTVAAEQARGQEHWLLPYAGAGQWRGTGRSLFVDGEVLVMVGARRVVARELGLGDRWSEETATRARAVTDAFGSASELPFAESYPNEGWTFCHTMALVGLRMHEALDGADHSALRTAWSAAARSHLVHGPTGLLNSEYTMEGEIQDGPEGSSLWFAVTALQLIDPELGRQQYALAREALGATFMGVGYAREWPAGYGNISDVDSGPIVPVLEASASSSGFAIVASRAHGDQRWHGQLVDALGAAEVVMDLSPWLAQAADNPVGQSVVLWGLGFGPLWEQLEL